MMLHAAHHHQPVIRMDAPIPLIDVGPDLIIVMTQQFFPALGEKGFASGRPPVPDSVIGAGYRQHPTLLAGFQCPFQPFTPLDLAEQLRVALFSEFPALIGQGNLGRQALGCLPHAVQAMRAPQHQQRQTGRGNQRIQ